MTARFSKDHTYVRFQSHMWNPAMLKLKTYIARTWFPKSKHTCQPSMFIVGGDVLWVANCHSKPQNLNQCLMMPHHKAQRNAMNLQDSL